MSGDTHTWSDDIQAKFTAAALDRDKEHREQHSRADKLINPRGTYRNRVGELYTLGPVAGDDYVAEVTIDTVTYWTAVVDGVGGTRVHNTLNEALVHFADISLNGANSGAYEYAVRVLHPVPQP